jgi:serine/threonine protein kinase
MSPIALPRTTRDDPSYKPGRWEGFKRSPIRTRRSCREPDHNAGKDDEDDESTPPSPSPRPDHQLARNITLPESQNLKKSQGDDQRKMGKPRIQDRAFCTQKCLIGLAHGGPMDMTCPNIKDHKCAHIDRLEFLSLIRAQLAMDRGRVDYAPLDLYGALGALFKLRLSSHGYTLVAKGMEKADLERLQHEHSIYTRLQPIQGEHVPVCLGMVDLVMPCYYDHGTYTHFLLLSWGGLPLSKCLRQLDKPDVLSAVETAYSRVHQLGVLHLDPEPRNILYDMQDKRVMIIDFERANVHDRQPLGLISHNSLARKRERAKKDGREGNIFIEERQQALANISRYY